ncbi:hypothetical protein R3P38DRAFT_3335211 [Favolaschia claudopus]|uniref:Uncharacterized protein n=1 Tax=Favolaschia claudopus TaxID=2862362 RepID=A0AAV9Z9S4_9AGAR
MSSLLEMSRRLRAAQPPPSTPDDRSNPPSSPSPFLPNTSNNFLGSDPATSPPNRSMPPPSSLLLSSGISDTERLQNFGERLLKRVKVNEDTRAEFMQYIQTTNQQERDALHVFHLLHTKELLVNTTEERLKEWKPSKELAKVIRDHIWTILLLPNIKYYSGNVEAQIISTMRTNKVKELPAADSEEAPDLIKFVARELSLFRSQMKKEIADSLEDDETRNIANLAEQLLEHAPWVNPTLGLYYRIAFIRRHLRVHKHSISKFWGEVDAELEELHGVSAEEHLQSLRCGYDEDVVLFGDPTKTPHRPKSDTFTADCAKRLKALSAAAAKVQTLGKKAKNTKNRKRKRAAEPEEEEAEPSGSGGGAESNEPEGGSGGREPSSADDDNDDQQS